ncbi:hypothetical protein [Flavobacterium aestuarii]|uniref:hypothetical protein n=1 Tax=Flavobacterium aestuarii TaxID=3149227 RepID=UPI0032B40540
MVLYLGSFGKSENKALFNPKPLVARERYGLFKNRKVTKNNPEILFKEHLKIYVLPKDKIIFENELENQNIEYYSDIENQPMFENGIRYFILDADRIKLDKIFTENGIIAHTETITASDYRDEKKAMKLYLIVGGIVAGIMILIAIVESLLK